MSKKIFYPLFIVLLIIIIAIILWPKFIIPNLNQTEDEDGLPIITQEEIEEIKKQECQKTIIVKDVGIYYSTKGKRYVFQNQESYDSWFDCQPFKIMSAEEVSNLPLAPGAITLKPGHLIKTPLVKGIYFVDYNRTLRKIKDENNLQQIFGQEILDKVIDLPNYYFTEYQMGGSFDYLEPPLILENITIEQNFNL